MKSSNIDAGDLFGYAVALSRDGSVLAVGAFDEDGSGAAGERPGRQPRRRLGRGLRVHPQPAATWTQQAYIKPSNSETQDSFGVDVALSDDGTTLLVGSLDEDCAVDRRQRARLRQRLARRPVDGRRLRLRAQRWRRGRSRRSSSRRTPAPTTWFGERLALSGDGNVAVDQRVGRGRQRQGHQRARRRRRHRRRRRLSVHADRHDVAPAGLRQGKRTPKPSTSSAAR